MRKERKEREEPRGDGGLKEGKRGTRELAAARFGRDTGGNRWEPTVTNKSNTNIPAV